MVSGRTVKPALQSLSVEDLSIWFRTPARQQPVWPDPWLLESVRTDLAKLPGLVDADSAARLRALLARVADGRMRVVQAGDCAEDPAESNGEHVRARIRLLDTLAEVMLANTEAPVVRIGRMAGQLTKPRSEQTERVGGIELPVYRGSMVNGPSPDPVERTPDPLRLLTGYHVSKSVMAGIDDAGRGTAGPDDAVVWTSHEALLLDYEVPMLGRTEDGDLLLASTHLPWIGERTRQLDGAHVRLLASVINPVACKVGPSMTPAELVRLCRVLDPNREPGRLTLIARIGAEAVLTTLPSLVRAVRDAGHPVIWLCDPMHGNTVRAADGRKTRVVSSLVREVEGFQDAVLMEQGVAGGVHIEATPNEVAECVWSPGEEPGEPYTTLCDPRLNPRQAAEVVSTWLA